MDPFDATLRYLAQVRRRLAAVARAETFFAVLVAVLVASALGLGLAAALGEGAGRWGWLALGVGLFTVGYIGWRLWLKPRRARARDAELALWVEERVPDLRSGLVTSVEVADLLKAKRGELGLGFSPQLAAEAAQRTAERLTRVAPHDLPDRRRLGRLRWLATGAVAAAALAIGLAPGLWARGATNLVAPGPVDEADGERLVDVAVSQLDLEITPPKYAGLEPRKLPRGSGDLEALTGSEVRFATTALFKATGAALVLQSHPEDRWMLELETDGTIRGGFEVGESDRFQFVLIDQHGQMVRERVWRNVSATPDRPPEVTLLLPEQDLEVKPSDTVQFFFESSDDLGIDRVELVVLDEQATEVMRRRVAESKGNRIEKGHTALEVPLLGLEPGQAVDVHFEVADRNTLSGPGVGKSQSRRIQLYSPEAEHDKLLGRLEALIERMLDLLAERLETPLASDQPHRIGDFVQIQQLISAATDEITSELESILQGLTTDTMAKDELRDGVREVLGQIRDVSEQERAHIKKWVLEPDLADPRVLTQLLVQTNDEAVTVFEEGILRLKKLLDGALKDAILEAGRELLDTQNEIMELLKKLKDTQDPAAREAALKKLKQLQDKLAKLQQQLARAQDKAPYENQNPGQRPNENQASVASMQDTMKKVQELIEQGKIDEAMKLLEEMNKSTQELMAALEDDLEGSGGSMNPEARRKLQQFQQALNEVADGQRGLQGETKGLESEIDKRQAEELQAQAKEKLAEMRGKAKEMREALEKVPEGALPAQDKQALEQLEKAAEGVEQALEQMKLGPAGQGAQQVEKDAEGLSQEVGESEARELDEQRLGELKQAMEQLDKAGEAAAELSEMLGELMPKPGEGMSPGEQGKAGQLGQRQQTLEEKLMQLQQQLDEMEGEFPGMKGEMGPRLDEAAKKMGEAKGELEGNKPGPAAGKQQEALEQLQQAQQSMEQRMKQAAGQKGGEDDNTGISDPKAEVEIPKDDPYARPRNLREELLKAMQERAPERYKDAIRKYYEELTH